MIITLFFFIFQNPTNPPALYDLSWLTGSWISEDGLTEEHWTTPAGHMILGMNRMQRTGKMAFFEYLRIEKRQDGIYYVASPKGGTPVSFKLTALQGQKAIFENPNHDFPQIITYERTGPRTLCASISGGEAQKKREVRWCFSSHPPSKASE